MKLSGSDGTELWRYQVTSSTSALLGRGGYGVSYVRGVAVGDRENNPVLVGTTMNRLVEGVGEPGDWDFFAIKVWCVRETPSFYQQFCRVQGNQTRPRQDTTRKFLLSRAAKDDDDDDQSLSRFSD